MSIPFSRRKSKGSVFERQLIRMFWDNGWAASRIAGSGSSSFFSPDVIAGRNGRVIVIEAKTSNNSKKYLSLEEVVQLREFASIFGAEPWIAVKFKNNNIKFVSLNNATFTSKSVVVSVDDPLLFSFEDLIG